MLRVWNSGCSLYRRLGLAEAGDAGAFLPFAGFAKEFEALVALKDVAFTAERAGGTETAML
jgi:hypothetical protein